MDFPYVYMMNSENPTPEENVEDPIVEEAFEPEIPPLPPTFDSFSQLNVYTQGFSFDTIKVVGQIL